MSFLIQGRRPVLAALLCVPPEHIKTLYCTEKTLPEIQDAALLAARGKLVQLPGADFRKRFPDGRGLALELLSRPAGKRTLAQATAEGQGLIVVTDRIQDVQNLSSIVRSAEALGAKSLIVTGSGARMDETAYRISAGAAFFLDHFFHGSLKYILETLRNHNYTIFLSKAGEQSAPATLPPLKQRALVIGSEYHGIKSGVERETDIVLSIPMRGHTESLNAGVAAGILIHQLMAS
ncbi:MAG: RNA methyltransferase [Spirochaetales bacterium]|nr:RNA methyltransferase [Spirochaetales bacterium]